MAIWCEGNTSKTIQFFQGNFLSCIQNHREILYKETTLRIIGVDHLRGDYRRIIRANKDYLRIIRGNKDYSRIIGVLSNIEDYSGIIRGLLKSDQIVSKED